MVAGSTWQTTQSAWIIKANLAEIKSGSVDKFHKPHAVGVMLFHVDILTDGQTWKSQQLLLYLICTSPKNRSQSMWKWLWSNLGYYSAALWEGLRKTMNNLSYDSDLASNQNTSLKHEREYYCVVMAVTVDLLLCLCPCCHFCKLTLILLTWSIGWAINNVSRWQMQFNLAFKG